MKSITSLNLDVSVVEALKARAKAEGRSTSAVANRALAGFLAVARPPSPDPALSPRARLVLGAVTALTEADRKLPVEDPAWMFHRYRMDQICRQVGDFPSKVLPALRECERAGVLKCVQLVPLGMDAECPKLDHWKLPSE